MPYYWAGIKAYDFVAGGKRVKPSYYLSKERALGKIAFYRKNGPYLRHKKSLFFVSELFPMLRKDKLCGALVYYDGMEYTGDESFCCHKYQLYVIFTGQQNDARMNLSIALTATRLGATIANHVKVLDLVKERV